MSDAQPVADALKAAFSAQGIAHAEGKKPDVTAGHPYIVWWLDPGRVFDRSLKSRDGFSMRLVLQEYGNSPDAVRLAVRKGRAAVASLEGRVVGDRVLMKPSHDAPPPPEREDSGTTSFWWQTDVWNLPTSPA